MFVETVKFLLLAVVTGLPTNFLVRRVAESNNLDDLDNYIPRYDDFAIPHEENHNKSLVRKLSQTKNDTNVEEITKKDLIIIPSPLTVNRQSTTEFSTFDLDKNQKHNKIDGNKTENKQLKITDETSLKNIYIKDDYTKETSRDFTNKEDSLGVIFTDFKENLKNRTEAVPKDVKLSEKNSVIDDSDATNETTRNPTDEPVEDDPEFAPKESQEEGSNEEDEEDMNMVTGILSALLGGFSKPDGGIDLDAIVGLIGSLSTQNDDGSYDFSGLTDLLKGFFGGGGDEGGGSDIGAFVGGLLGAVIKGIANPPGGKGVGVLTAKLLSGILPALSVQPDSAKPGGIDIGGFLGGFLKTLFGASQGGNINPVKFLISTISSLSNSKPNPNNGEKWKSESNDGQLKF